MSDQKRVEPFFFYSDTFPKILFEEKITIAFTTYQAGKLVFLSSINGETIIKYGKSFKRPMGLAVNVDASKLALASTHQIDIFGHKEELARNYPERLNHYDRLFIPQCKYHTGFLDTHEIGFGNEGLWVVNTKFSTLCLMDENFHYKTAWKPPFITDFMPQDRCHLNGMILKNGKPKYVTMFSQTDTPEGWKELPKENGLIMDVDTNEVLLGGLAMPHSPILHEDKIYFLQSGTGQVMCFDLSTRNLTVIAEMGTFVRGLELFGDYLVVGASELREKSSSFGQLPISGKTTYCGVYIIDRHTGQQVGGISYTKNIKELFAVKVLRNVQTPGLLTERDEWYNKCIMGDGAQNFWLKKADVTE